MGDAEMSKVGESLLKGAEEALLYAKGNRKHANTKKVKIEDDIDVFDIRQNLNMSREEFSGEFGFSLRTLEKWERGERLPTGPTRAYLTVIARDPRAVIKALSER